MIERILFCVAYIAIPSLATWYCVHTTRKARKEIMQYHVDTETTPVESGRPDQFKRLCDLTLELTRLRQNECKHLCVENFSPKLLKELMEAAKQND